MEKNRLLKANLSDFEKGRSDAGEGSPNMSGPHDNPPASKTPFM